MIKFLLILLAASVLAAPGAAMAQDTELTVMSFNLWRGGANAKKPVDEMVAVIRAARADIIGVQETRKEGAPCTAQSCPPAGESLAPKIAAALGFYVYDQTKAVDAVWANAVISRYPIRKATPNDLGVEIDVRGRKVHVYNLHLDHAPYQPYQLLGIKYGPFPFLKTAGEAVKAAADTRGPALKLLFDEMAAVGDADATFIIGDFNEPSHRDWTEATVKAGLQPLAVPYPTVMALEEKGFTDTFRAVYPDPVAKPGFTWTPRTRRTAKDDHHDRIDFVLARAPRLQVLSAGIVGEKAPEADIVVTPWPSDHRAPVAKIRF